MQHRHQTHHTNLTMYLPPIASKQNHTMSSISRSIFFAWDFALEFIHWVSLNWSTVGTCLSLHIIPMFRLVRSSLVAGRRIAGSEMRLRKLTAVASVLHCMSILS
jgi:hypothetical protein